ncbi:uncharacterized protein LOC109819983 isoform X1 [Asparagus officinalis]|uniref:uncharacterized protein LOC109819983 isoform X1 n=1 Tax=Asparagus officinalis TaxID=4686 RepID=UPI00098DF0CE|nr:uncharacterized protein LOC109819983 isoform X1 [Asparagus officinalis]
MSRREERGSYSKRLHSRSGRDPSSPKKSRRDGKQATERTYSSSHRRDVDTLVRDQKQHRIVQDALPLEGPPTETKVQPETIKEGLDRKVNGLPGGMKHSSHTTEVPRSRNYFQHDERDSAGQGGRSSGRRATDHGRWSEPKEQSSERIRDKSAPKEQCADDKNSWRHDGFFELQKTEAPPARKRPAFREKKIEAPAETDAAANPTRREERGHNSRELERKLDRPVSRADERNFKRGDEYYQRGEMQRGSYQSRERLNGAAIRGRERFNGRRGERSTNQSGGFQAEKWKHDLFDDANKSPPPKNEEEQIAKVEALLAL